MKILFIEMTNYGPFYETHRFDLTDRGLLLVMGDNQDEPRMDSNGSGKSSIFDALDWCLWGDNPRGDHAEAMFNEEAFGQRGAKCEVWVKIQTDAGTDIDIIRTRTKSKYDLEVTADGTTLTTLDTKESQKVIEQLLGLDREVFHAAVLFGQTDLVHYADASDATRMEILTRLLQLDEVDRYLERVKAKVKASGERTVRLQADLAGVEGQLRATRPEDLDAQIEQWVQENQAARTRMQGLLDQKAAERQTLLSQLEDLNSLKMMKESVDHELAELKAPPVSPEVAWCDRAVETARTQQFMAQMSLNGVKERLDKILSQGEGVCSECGQPITAQHLQNEAQKLQAAFQEATETLQGTRARVEAAEADREAANQRDQEARQVWQASRDQKMQESASLQARIQVVANQARQIEALEREMADFQFELDRAQVAVNPFLARKAQVEQERYDLERKQGQIQYEIEALGVDAKYLDFWVHGLGPKGLKSYILDSRLQELSDAANEWMRVLTGGTIWVRFESQKETRGKKVVNAPDVRVSRWNPDGTITERSYRSWSGGERQRISFAIDFGLSRLVARRATQRYDLLILDEAFRHLDRAGKEAVMEMLQALAREKSSLIVVEHDTEFQAQFERQVMVTKRNRRSTIKELDHVPEKDQGISAHISANPPGKRAPKRSPVRRAVD